MKSHNALLAFLPFLFCMVTKVQAQQSNGHLPQCPNTAPQAVIQVLAAPQGQGRHYKLVAGMVTTVIVGGAVTGAVAAAAATAGAGTGYGIEKAFINEDVEFPGRGGVLGGLVGGLVGGVGILGVTMIVVIVVVCRCIR